MKMVNFFLARRIRCGAVGASLIPHLFPVRQRRALRLLAVIGVTWVCSCIQDRANHARGGQGVIEVSPRSTIHFWRTMNLRIQTALVHLLLLLLLCPQPAMAQRTTAPPTDDLRGEQQQGTATAQAQSTPAPPALTPTLTTAEVAEQAVDRWIEDVLARMSPEERVGQLFVTTVAGNLVDSGSTVSPTNTLSLTTVLTASHPPPSSTRSSAEDIVTLVHDYHIGGIILMPNKGNFVNAKRTNTPRQLANLSNQLQALAYHYQLPPNNALPALGTRAAVEALLAQSTRLPFTSTTEGPAIPLLIGVEQLGDSYPDTSLRRAFTPLPSQMALGATWNPSLVEAIGQIVGKELSAVGINLLLGPTLDVVDQPRTDVVGALGIQSFGGDPYWVSRLGSAYISGVHQGSNQRVATIARHFPGQGDIDRLPNQEVATVQKSQTELRRTALPPFLAVTRQNSPLFMVNGNPTTVDGLMTSHMRFSAFQGSGTGRIPPFSMMPDLGMRLSQEGLGAWQQQGGLLMTNALGVPAIRRYYEMPGQDFSYRRIALEAFTAGHDLIYLAQLSATNDWADEMAHIIDVIYFFRERYNNENDSDFRRRVDDAVRRILRLKYGLYTTAPTPGAASALPSAGAATLTPLENVLINANDLAIFQDGSEHRLQSTATIAQVARESISLLHPDLADLAEVLPAAPQADDRILIFSDSRLFQECHECTVETMLGPEELKSIITHLYGSDPGATGQIASEQVVGRSFAELAELLEEQTITAGTMLTGTTTVTNTPTAATAPVSPLPRTPTTGVVATPISSEETDSNIGAAEQPIRATARLQQQIDESNWIIFAMLNIDPATTAGSQVVKQFLNEQEQQLEDKRIIVLALNAPYFLDATEISKLTAYFGVYSKTQPFLESAVRAIFRGYTPIGAPPVSVPGTRFSTLEERLQPDPAQPLALTILREGEALPLESGSDVAAATVEAGAVLQLQLTQILDRNGHPVPDNLAVSFMATYADSATTLPIETVFTRNGNAQSELVVEQPGRLQLSAKVGDATTLNPLTLKVQGGGTVMTQATDNTPATTIAVQQTTTPSGTTPLSLETAAPTGTGLIPIPANQPWANWITLIIALLTILVTLSLLLILQIRIMPRSMLVHNMLWATICGLSAYILFGLGLLPGAGFLRSTLQFWSSAVVVFIGMLLPLLWLQLRAE